MFMLQVFIMLPTQSKLQKDTIIQYRVLFLLLEHECSKRLKTGNCSLYLLRLFLQDIKVI